MNAVMLLLALRMVAAPRAAEPAPFKYQWEVGRQVEFRTTVQAQALIQMGNQQMPLPIQGRFSYTLECIAVEEGKVTLKVTLGEVKMTADQQEMKAEKGIAPPFVLVVDSFGKPLEIKGLEEDEKAPELAGLNFYYQYFLLQLTPFAFPDKPLNPGETWLTAADVAVKGADPMNLKSASRFQRVEAVDGQNCAKVDTRVNLPVKVKLPQFGNVEVEGKMQGAITTHFAIDEGQVRQSVSQLQAQLTVTGLAAGQGGQGGQNQAQQDVKANVQAQLQMKRVPAEQQ
jgi:hypothetical protein